MPDFMTDERFDPYYINVANTARGIEPLLDTMFSFLRRKTDFFDGPPPNGDPNAPGAWEKIQQVFAKHAQLHQKEKEKKKAAAEKKKKAAEALKLKKEKQAHPAEAAAAASVIEMGKDGDFDVSSAATITDVDGASKKESEPAADKPVESAQETKEEEEKSRKKDKGVDDRPPPPPGNGGTVPDKYVWAQTLQEVTVTVPVPDGTRGRDLEITMAKRHLNVRFRGPDGREIVNAPLYRSIIMEDSFWTVEDGNRLVIQLQKLNEGGGLGEWWTCVCEGDPVIDITAIRPENSKLDDLDGEVRQTVEKMWYDQRQKALGLPTSEDEKKSSLLAKLKEQHPEMDFSNAVIN